MARSTVFTDRPEPGPFSSFWRKNTSSLESVELANLLRALRKVAGHLGRNTGRIDYAGMSRSAENDILLEPGMVMGQYPVPPEKVDYLVGVVTHEALHRTEWSTRVWKLLEPEFERLAPMERVVFQKVVYAGEDIYVDHVADETVFGLYTRAVRKQVFSEIRKELGKAPPSLERLLYRWWAVSCGHDPGLDENPDVKEAMGPLKDLTTFLLGIDRAALSITARCQHRAQAFRRAWPRLKKNLMGFKVLDKTLHWYPSAVSVRTAGSKKSSAGGKPGNRLPGDLVREIEMELAAHSPDLTPIIRSVVGEDDDSVVPISRMDFTIPAHPMIDRRLVSRLRAVFLSYAGANLVASRGLSSGRIDRRRLYRAPVTGRCFKQVDRRLNLDWSVTLLMDASGSMRGGKWRMVENTVANLHQALSGYQNRLEAYAYYEADGICMMSKLIKGKHIMSVPPAGQTASGQALIAAAYLMPQDRQRNILIHVTDGESNFGCAVQYGLDYCRQQNIHLITLGCGYKDKEAMRRQYGKSIQFLQHFGQLPQAMERLFKWTFLYGSKPHLMDNFRLKKDTALHRSPGHTA